MVAQPTRPERLAAESAITYVDAKLLRRRQCVQAHGKVRIRGEGVFVCLCLCMRLCVFVFLCVCACLSVCLSLSLCLSFSLSVSLSISVSLSVSVSLCVSLSFSLALSASVSASLSHVPSAAPGDVQRDNLGLRHLKDLKDHAVCNGQHSHSYTRGSSNDQEKQLGGSEGSKIHTGNRTAK